MLKSHFSEDILSFYKVVSKIASTTGIALGISFIGSVILTRELGPEGRGIIAWAISLSTIVIAISNVGMGNVNKRFVAEDKKRAGDLLIVTILLCILMSIVIIPVFYFYGISQEIGQNNTIVLIIALIMAPLASISETLGEMLIGLHKTKQSNFCRISNKSINMLIIVLLFLTDTITLFSAITALLIASGIQCFLTLYYLREDIKHRLNDFRWIFKRIKTYMMLTYFTNLIMVMPIQIIIISLATKISLEAAGLYTACMIIINAVSIFMRSIAVYAMPKLIGIKDKEEKRKFKKNIIAVTLILCTGASLTLILIADWLIPMLFGDEFIESVSTFKILLIGMIFFSCFATLNAIIFTELKGFMIMVSPIIMLLALCVSLYILMPLYGADGAAVAWVIAGFFAMTSGFVVIRL